MQVLFKRETVNHLPHVVYLHILRQHIPIITNARNAAIHEKASLGGLFIELTIKLFVLVVSVWNSNTHYLPLKFHASSQ